MTSSLQVLAFVAASQRKDSWKIEEEALVFGIELCFLQTPRLRRLDMEDILANPKKYFTPEVHKMFGSLATSALFGGETRSLDKLTHLIKVTALNFLKQKVLGNTFKRTATSYKRQLKKLKQKGEKFEQLNKLFQKLNVNHKFLVPEKLTVRCLSKDLSEEDATYFGIDDEVAIPLPPKTSSRISNRWCTEEEILLVGAVCIRFTEKLTIMKNSTQPRWDSIKELYDKMMTKYQSVMNRFCRTERKSKALQKHWKVLKNQGYCVSKLYREFEVLNKDQLLLADTKSIYPVEEVEEHLKSRGYFQELQKTTESTKSAAPPHEITIPELDIKETIELKLPLQTDEYRVV